MRRRDTLRAIGVNVAAALLLVYVSSHVLESLGWGVFVFMPIALGALTVLVFTHHRPYSRADCLGVAFTAGCASLASFLVFGLEGILCLAMAFPIVTPLYVLGGVLGIALCRTLPSRRLLTPVWIPLLAVTPVWMGIASRVETPPAPRAVQTRVVIRGTPAEVWNEVIAFSPIPEPEAFWFRMGIAYPTHARIEGSGVGAVRYCEFSTGAFVEPITHWEPERRLAFDVRSQPMPMTEVSPYSGLHPPHLDSAIQSHKGEFRLRDLGDGRVELTGTTWYHLNLRPVSYWALWSDPLIHSIHRRVLRHIQSTVEQP